MRLALALALAMLVVPACKSHKQPDDMQQVRKEAPDAKPTMHVAEDDPRYVASPGAASRQVHYYSAKTDTTYVVDESTGRVLTTFKSRDMPGVVIIDKPTYQPPPLKTEPATEPPAEGEVEEATEIEEVPAEGCGCGQ